MRKTVFSRPESKENHKRNSFDRSFVSNYNFSAGMLLPTFVKFCFGNSHVKINQRSFFRTADVNTAAFPSLPHYTDYYFVPMHQIISGWNDFRSLTNDRHSSKLPVPLTLPSFTVRDVRSCLNTTLASEWNDLCGFNRTWGSIRLLDLLGYGWNIGDVSMSSIFTTIFDNFPDFGSQNPLALCAYQKVYYDHYRNTAYESNNVKRYNLDYLYGGSGDSCTPDFISTNELCDMMEMHYVNYRRDVFNTIYPSLNFISSRANPLNSVKFRLPATVVGIGGIYQGSILSNSITTPSVSSDGNAVAPSSVAGPAGSAGGFTLQNLRASYALERLARVSAFAPQHVIDQFEARFGYRPRSASMHESVRLGSFSNSINIGEVTSTAQTDPDASLGRLGSIGGKGVGASDYENVITYDVPEDGFIIGVSYVLPRLQYDTNFVSQINQQFAPEDWSLPEFDNLSLQPVLRKHVCLEHSTSESTQDDRDTKDVLVGNAILGYTPRDMQYKAEVSVNHGLFNAGFPLSIFTTHGKRKSYFSRYLNDGLSAAYFKCTPSDLDDIFVEQADGQENSDQFFGQIVVSFACIQDKPIFGIPSI